MKFLTTVLFVLYLLIGLSHEVQCKKFAFLLGIEEYYPESSLLALESVSNDLYYMELILESQGFDCIVLNASGFSKKSIIDQFNAALLDRVGPSDIALFYYTGHGTQILDYNYDECSDNLDEAIVLSNFNQTNPEETQYILDDEINELLHPVRKKIGDNGQMVLIFDACHSGSISRGNKNVSDANSDYGKEVQRTDQIRYSFLNCGEYQNDRGLASLIGLYSSSDAELSFEFGEGDKKFGVFTYALLERLRFCDEDYSYSDWIRQSELFMSDKFATIQKPTAEGDLDQLIWQKGVDKSPFPQGIFLKKSNNKTSIVNPSVTVMRGGRLIVYPKGTKDTSIVEPLAVIKYEDIDIGADGVMNISSEYDGLIGDSDWIFIENSNPKSGRLKIYFEDYDEKVYQTFRELMTVNLYFEVTDKQEDANLIFTKTGKRKKSNLILLNKVGQVIENKLEYENYSAALLYRHFFKKITAYNNALKIRKLNLNNSLDLEWSIDKVDEYGDLIEKNSSDFRISDYVDVKIKNVNTIPVFIYLYYIDSSFSVDQLFTKEVKLMPDQATSLESICELVEPKGKDTFSILISKYAVNLNINLPSTSLRENPIDYIFSRLSLNKPIVYDLEGIADIESCAFMSKEIIIKD